MTNAMADIRVVELFAGVGGFRLGLEKASERYKVIWADQWEPSMKEQYAFECYQKHFGEGDNIICADIAKVKDAVPQHDLLVGGFPCQDYSIMNKGAKGIKGKKGQLWWQIDHIIENKRPPYILLENVDRILRSPGEQKGRDFAVILRCLYEKGYAVEWRVINAAEYGQGQRRRRTFIIAYHNDTDVYRKFAEDVCKYGLKAMHKNITKDGISAKAFPISGHSREYTDKWIDEMIYSNIGDVMDKERVDLYNAGVMMNGRIYSINVDPMQEPSIAIEKILERRSLPEKYFVPDKDLVQWEYLKGAKDEIRTKKDGQKYRFTEGAVQFPESLNKPSRTLLTSEAQMGRATHIVTDPLTGRLRTLTPVECERLNGFPDGWTETGMPEKMRYFCMGNALVVPLITRIGTILSHFLN